jgi:hypothetical protein
MIYPNTSLLAYANWCDSHFKCYSILFYRRPNPDEVEEEDDDDEDDEFDFRYYRK